MDLLAAAPLQQAQELVGRTHAEHVVALLVVVLAVEDRVEGVRERLFVPGALLVWVLLGGALLAGQLRVLGWILIRMENFKLCLFQIILEHNNS